MFSRCGQKQSEFAAKIAVMEHNGKSAEMPNFAPAWRYKLLLIKKQQIAANHYD
ncbi:hypothetical protein Dfer_4101 [Dyadobacter fermentans DSM 18053]|uniref:Uncharacterized protein n=1 Tax=Dyadobacter fermentans (strain ATCC 700827 / DSM 18053 / CIP 107007 / KCTC 52180 / NS114) TaxID=471854 RepID=C6VZX7_DYAFD|nr:hypothetical protein Dfer_4101 [Dyadobacter fermentans DSM 18053]